MRNPPNSWTLIRSGNPKTQRASQTNISQHTDKTVGRNLCWSQPTCQPAKPRSFRTTLSFIPVLLPSFFVFNCCCRSLPIDLPFPTFPWCLPCLQDTEGSLPPATGLAAADDSAVGHQAAPQLRAAQLRQQRQAAVPLVASVPLGRRPGRPLGRLQQVTSGDVTDGVDGDELAMASTGLFSPCASGVWGIVDGQGYCWSLNCCQRSISGGFSLVPNDLSQV